MMLSIAIGVLTTMMGIELSCMLLKLTRRALSHFEGETNDTACVRLTPSVSIKPEDR